MLPLTSKHAQPTMATLADLLCYCRKQARIERCDHTAASWGQAVYARNQALNLCRKEFGARLNRGAEELISGKYERLTIHADGTPEYTVGQYAPIEIYDYLHFYLRQTNAV